MYSHAVSGSGEFWGIASAQVHSQPDASVSLTGAVTYPFKPLTGLSSASSVPAATVASYHMATLPSWYWARHSLNEALAASSSPASLSRARAISATSSQVGLSGIVSPASSSTSLRYIRNDDSA